ncbi:GDSL-type esterase/lipase family protein [Paenibacillus sp. alder61]|uniref:Copper amine oxidase n=1 Tax=Paenibacillus faecis TaxID=862114 RepID=A0A5D0CNZ2_9BACL|nr:MULTISPECIES: GDSL-type esterase/lipase family protein [Paenibacillus]MCA1296643.1 GDSL-type esterase/lipase family protein [Paenibacillus sp. alder61]TYA11703.1 copper amine oxidase [Paenibacillus faecis]
MKSYTDSKKGRHRLLAATLAAAVLFGGCGTSALAAAPVDGAGEGPILRQAVSEAKQQRLIVALGDSITAGYEPGMTEDSEPYGYVERLREQALYHGRAEAVNYGILGLTTSGLLNYLTAIQKGQAVSADQIQQGLPDPRASALFSNIAETKARVEQADIITITIGGNDILALMDKAGDMTEAELKAEAAAVLAEYGANMEKAVTLLAEMNPRAQIILADQYQPVPKLAGAALYRELQKVAGTFTSQVDELVARFTAAGINIKAAHVAKAFAGKELFLTHIYKEDVHPTQAGYETIAKVMAESIWGEYRKSSSQTGKREISIVIKGQELLTPYPPVVNNGQTFVALKDITDAIGGQSRWNAKTRTATVTYEGRTVGIPIGAKEIIANGARVATASPAFLHQAGSEQKVYAPLAVLVSGIGLDIQYSAKLKTVFINL